MPRDVFQFFDPPGESETIIQALLRISLPKLGQRYSIRRFHELLPVPSTSTRRYEMNPSGPGQRQYIRSLQTDLVSVPSTPTRRLETITPDAPFFVRSAPIYPGCDPPRWSYSSHPNRHEMRCTVTKKKASARRVIASGLAFGAVRHGPKPCLGLS